MRLPEFVGATRTTISSIKPIQRLLWLSVGLASEKIDKQLRVFA